jgi:hypothetical protein
MTWETVFNPGDTPRARDDEGRMIGAGSFGTARVDVDPVAADIAADRLIVVPTPDPVPADLDPEADAAMRETLRHRQQGSGRRKATAAAATPTDKTED